MNQIKIGKFISECRKEKKLTQSQLAEKLNLTDKAISKWETGRGIPDSSIMLELCEILGISANELLSGEKIDEEKYREKADRNIVLFTKEYEKNKRTKRIILTVVIILIILFIVSIIGKLVYNNFELNVKYDRRVINCDIRDDNVIFINKGLSVVNYKYSVINTENETMIFFEGKILLQNKIRSHFETWDSMAQLTDGRNPNFNTQIIIDKNKDIVNCKEKIKIYYTNMNVKKVNEQNYKKYIKNSELICES